jgi:hypothetical protein
MSVAGFPSTPKNAPALFPNERLDIVAWRFNATFSPEELHIMTSPKLNVPDKSIPFQKYPS